MQTMAIQIQDNYVQNFMSYANSHSNITGYNKSQE